MEDQKKLQTKYQEMQILEAQLQEFQKQVQKLEQQGLEIEMVKDSLGDFKGKKIGDELLVPITNGIFAKAQIKNTKELIVNVGANVAVTKSIENTNKLLDEQREEINNYKQQMMVQLTQLTEAMQKTEQELHKMMS
ncbi:prefoldin subunit alpha [Nanoarchaeota archaeon]